MDSKQMEDRLVVMQLLVLALLNRLPEQSTRVTDEEIERTKDIEGLVFTRVNNGYDLQLTNNPGGDV